MRRFLQTLACFFMLSLSFTACKIADDLLDLPEETQTGAQTFGCLVDSKRWKAYAEHTLDNAIEPEMGPTYFNARIENEIGDVPYIYFEIGDSSGIQEKTYRVGEGFSAMVTMKTDSLQGEVLYTNEVAQPEGYVTITKVKQRGADLMDKGILSGTFSFTAKSATSNRTTKVTEGRFDIGVY